MGRIAVAVTVILFGLLARAQTTFDLSADFSLRDNPNKVWQYGYSDTNSLAPDQFRFDKYSDGASPIGFWHPATSSGPGLGYYPYIAYNTTKQSQVWPSPNGWPEAGRKNNCRRSAPHGHGGEGGFIFAHQAGNGFGVVEW